MMKPNYWPLVRIFSFWYIKHGSIPEPIRRISAKAHSCMYIIILKEMKKSGQPFTALMFFSLIFDREITSQHALWQLLLADHCYLQPFVPEVKQGCHARTASLMNQSAQDSCTSNQMNISRVCLHTHVLIFLQRNAMGCFLLSHLFNFRKLKER